MQSKKQLILIGALFMLVGVIFIVAGFVVIFQDDDLKEVCTEQTMGTVVEVITESSYNASENEFRFTYYPVIEYQAGDRTVSKKSSIGHNPPKYKVGDKVEICYNPNNVEEYIIKGDSSSLILGIGFIVLGSIAAAVGYFAFIRKASNSGISEG